MSARRLAAIVAALLAACALAAPAALADGDPASDTLISLQLFLPYYLKLPPQDTKQLMQVIAQAKKKGYTVRVALIAHTYDLGSVAVLWRKPQVYSKFLASELANFNSSWVLVVMPNGYGIYHCVPKKRKGGYSDPCEGARPTVADRHLLAALPTPESSHQNVAAAAVVAVRKLAALHGAKVGSGGDGNTTLEVAAGGVVVVLGLGVGALFIVRRRRQPG